MRRIIASYVSPAAHRHLLGVARAAVDPGVADLPLQHRETLRVLVHVKHGVRDEVVEGGRDHLRLREEALGGVEDGVEPAGLVGALVVVVEGHQHGLVVSGDDHQLLRFTERREATSSERQPP